MARKDGKRKASIPVSGYQATLREEKSGRKLVSVVTKKNSSSVLKAQHLQNLATWAGGKARIPPLAALFGHRLAATAESTGIPLDPSLFPCQRCENLLQPGYNCTVRIEKCTAKRRRRKKLSVPLQNNVVYACHFCSHRNLKWGTPKGHMKEMFALRPKLISDSKPVCSMDQKCAVFGKDRDSLEEGVIWKANSVSKSNPNNSDEGLAIGQITMGNIPVTPFREVDAALPESMKKSGLGSTKIIRADSSSTTAETGTENSKSASTKRKRRKWSSLKEIAERSDHENERRIGNISIPFLL